MRSALVVPSPDQNSQPTRMADALRNLQCAVAQSQEAVFITDASGVITRVNPAFERLSGHTSLEIVGKDLSLITAGGAQSANYQRLWRHVFEEKQYTGHLHLESKSGESCEVELILTPVMGARGRIVSLVGTARRLQAAAPGQTQPQATDPAPSTSRLFHDLRNILMVVLAHADLANQCIPLDHSARRHLGNVKSAAQSAAALLHEFGQNGASHPQGTEDSGHAPGASSAQQESHASTSTLLRKRDSGPPAAGEKPVTILLVEDEALIRESSFDFLRSAGFHILSAGSGEEALDLLKSYGKPIDLLITDMALPQMSGSELAHQVTSAYPGTKILAISGHPEHWVMRHSDSPIKHFLGKPFCFSDLHAKVRDLIYEKKTARGVGAP